MVWGGKGREAIDNGPTEPGSNSDTYSSVFMAPIAYIIYTEPVHRRRNF